MRARLALMHSGTQCELREVLLKDKPAHMLHMSNKGTVPLMVFPVEDTHGLNADSNSQSTGQHVLDESIDIMHWALNTNPNRHLKNSKEWFNYEKMSIDDVNGLIEQNDFEFKDSLDKYKYSDRHPEHSQEYYLQQAMPFLEKLEGILSHSRYLTGNQFRLADAAILPFVRQFSMVEPHVFDALPLPRLQQWLVDGLASDLFISIMDKNPPWQANSGEDLVVFGDLETRPKIVQP